MRIDLNADLGEGMDDAAILPYLTSANVACAQHAGSPRLMDELKDITAKMSGASKEDLALIEKAYNFAAEAHKAARGDG